MNHITSPAHQQVLHKDSFGWFLDSLFKCSPGRTGQHGRADGTFGLKNIGLRFENRPLSRHRSYVCFRDWANPTKEASRFSRFIVDDSAAALSPVVERVQDKTQSSGLYFCSSFCMLLQSCTHTSRCSTARKSWGQCWVQNRRTLGVFLERVYEMCQQLSAHYHCQLIK